MRQFMTGHENPPWCRQASHTVSQPARPHRLRQTQSGLLKKNRVILRLFSVVADRRGIGIRLIGSTVSYSYSGQLP
jgi:hypothetical protein